MAFGDPFGRRFAGGLSDWRQEIDALKAAFSDAWTTDDTSQNVAEIHGMALILAIVAACSRRQSNLMLPTKALDFLGVLEQACGLEPAPSDTPQARRSALAARLKGIAGNALAQIYAVCSTISDGAFVGMVSNASAPSYMPGGSPLCTRPGVAGWDWTSQIATVAVQLSPTGWSLPLIEALYDELSRICPSWMSYCVGTEEGGFVCDLATCDLTLVDA